jgi:hypothetical protein
VVIKAGEEIVLQVGRTVLTISDDGFSVRSRMVATALPNVYDSVLELAPREGVSITGQEVSITGQRSLSIGDGFGGTLETELGVMEIKAREVSIEDFNTQSYAFLTIANSIKYAQAVASAGMGLDLLNRTKGAKNNLEKSFVKAWGHVDFWAEKATEIAELAEDLLGVKEPDKDWEAFASDSHSYKMSGISVPTAPPLPSTTSTTASTSPGFKENASKAIKSFCQIFIQYLDLILELTGLVYTAVETGCNNQELREEKENDPEKKRLADTNWKDKLNLAAIVVDNTIIEVALLMLLGLSSATTAKIELKADGQIVLNADTIQHVYDKNFSQCATPSNVIQEVSRIPGAIQATFKAGTILTEIINYSIETNYDNNAKKEEEVL